MMILVQITAIIFGVLAIVNLISADKKIKRLHKILKFKDKFKE